MLRHISGLPLKTPVVPACGDQVRDNIRRLFYELLHPALSEACNYPDADPNLAKNFPVLVESLETALFAHHSNSVSADYKAAAR